MNKEPVISVIVPVYNVEKYLTRCIDSILAQTFTDFELLLIDDGSKDKSVAMCDEYAKKDSRIRVFHKKNGGVSSARQLGVEKACGIYSIHVDGDDWIESNMLSSMYESIIENKADMVIADFFEDTSNCVIYNCQKTNSVSSIDILKDILSGNLFGSLWHKLIKHSIYKQFNIHFIPNINYCEDVLVLAQMLQHNIKVVFLREAFYHYDQSNSNSITRNYTAETFKSRKLFISELDKILPQSLYDYVIVAALRVHIEALHHKLLTKDDFYNYMPKSFSQILRIKISKKIKVVLVLSYIGLYDIAKHIMQYC